MLSMCEAEHSFMQLIYCLWESVAILIHRYRCRAEQATACASTEDTAMPLLALSRERAIESAWMIMLTTTGLSK